MEAEELIEMIIETKKWYEETVKSLEQVKESGLRIQFQDPKSGKLAQLPEEHLEGFKLGVGVAIEVLGNFPIKVEKNN